MLPAMYLMAASSDLPRNLTPVRDTEAIFGPSPLTFPPQTVSPAIRHGPAHPKIQLPEPKPDSSISPLIFRQSDWLIRTVRGVLLSSSSSVFTNPQSHVTPPQNAAFPSSHLIFSNL